VTSLISHGDLIMSSGRHDSRKPRAAITQTRWQAKYTKDELLNFYTLKKSRFFVKILKQILKNVVINIPNYM
jgi:hypothetical protein